LPSAVRPGKSPPSRRIPPGRRPNRVRPKPEPDRVPALPSLVQRPPLLTRPTACKRRCPGRCLRDSADFVPSARRAEGIVASEGDSTMSHAAMKQAEPRPLATPPSLQCAPRARATNRIDGPATLL
jgi:hypothetical protein